ncbi:TadE-like protein [Caulifigura coniformis]|uniref:TadE-like protein n=1 Tax=Caulifigura coniformis TaxID=2527983 RepID=A0A517S9N3_9PLAN|nr:TadE/TadG family type IV pilus assembly protein [Caulifigura coniformis]QDT52839.1 TadE-like protein [Caulifigura coniformis]
MNTRRPSSSVATNDRRGTATVEFAVIAPLFLLLVLGTWEMGTAVRASNNLTAAVREGGRLASMDFTGTVASNQTPNQKVEQDIRAFLNASGLPGALATISITHAEGANAGQTFNLANSTNYLALFKIRATIPFSSVSMFPNRIMKGTTLKAELVTRRGRVRSAN